MRLLFFIILSQLSLPAFTADNLDIQLAKYIKAFKYSAVEPIVNIDADKRELGRRLFIDKRLSLTNDKACLQCHMPPFATSDGLPLSIGVGQEFTQAPPFRLQANAKLTKRHSPHLLNKGHKEFKTLFADGRVAYDEKNKKWLTPDTGLNNLEPGYEKIAKTLDSVLAAQSLFPLLDSVEMRGENFPHLTNLQVWDKITKKIMSDPKYVQLFSKVYPGEKINIAHIGNSIAYLERHLFQVTNTRWDKYLRGDLSALTDQQKRGAIVFSTKAKCSACHTGKHLTNFEFENTLVPSISQGGQRKDKGRFEVTGLSKDKYTFIVSPLRNISRTAPYFHSGSTMTLEGVLAHYLDPVNVFINFSPHQLTEAYGEIYSSPLIRDLDSVEQAEMISLKSRRLAEKIILTTEQQTDLLSFLEEGLSPAPKK